MFHDALVSFAERRVIFMTKINTGNANREYKDRLFRFVFGAEENKAYLLSLCNAVSGTDYTDVDDIEITTLSDAIYIWYAPF